LLLRAEESGIPVAVLPLLWMALHFSKVVFSLIGGDLSDKVGRKKMIFAGWIIYALVYAGFAFVETAWQAWALFIIYGAYFGLTGGAEKALVADLVPPEKRGTAFGFYNLAFSITVFPASIIFGALWTQFGASAAFLISALISICSAILLLTIQTNKKSENNKG
jgi:MFS family permease